jgi:hypothetical protein
VVTGGGYKLTEIVKGGGGGGIIQTSFKTLKEFGVDNPWHIETSAELRGTVRVYAECLKLVPEWQSLYSPAGIYTITLKYM